MGTNYYIRRPDNEKWYETHIGKSSAGWCFSLHVHPELNINTLDDWKREFAEPNTKIFDEYNREVSIADMIDTITNRSWTGKDHSHDKIFLDRNYAIVGPNGLMRHRLMVGHCVGHGEGTYDYIVGEFS